MRQKGLCRARDRAVAFVKERPERDEWQQGALLPPMRAFADMADVSLVSMVKALNSLKQRGLVSGAPGRRLRAGPPSAVDSRRSPRRASWQRKQELLERATSAKPRPLRAR